ncbi:uncharacterized protein LOC134254226 [Saccostrea cucullata]|uniref:uncharacterized protein LOC134254226 n=1 Tax=Saccostrea cuccullata TaxID=36930 RepID=UPI002ED30FC1
MVVSFGCLLVTLLLGNLVSSEKYDFKEKLINVIQNPQSWQASERTCDRNYEKLATFKDEQEMFEVERKLHEFTNRSLATFWIGGRETKYQWVWSHDQRPQMGRITGCFQGNLTFAVYTNLHNNHPELCTAFCKIVLKRPFAALQDLKCYCLYDTTSLQETQIYECNRACAGNPGEFCGGQNRSSVFPTWDSVEWGLHEPTTHKYGKDCALLMSSKDEYVWSTEFCSQHHQFICYVKESAMCEWLKQPTPCLYVVSEKTDWYTASYKCNQMHGYLVDRDAIFHHNLNLSNVYYWTGLTRKRQIWTDGSTIDLSLRRHIPFLNIQEKLCIALQYRKDGGWGLTSTSCSRKYPSLCQSGLRYASEDIQVNGPPHFHNNTHTPTDTTQTTHVTSIKGESPYMETKLMYWVFVPAGAVILLFLSMVLVGFYIKRSRQATITEGSVVTKTTEEKVVEPFYYILEKRNQQPKSGIYNNIFLENHCILNYNQLNFEGTLKQLVQDSTKVLTADEKSIHENDYDTMSCKLHQYEKLSHGKMQIYCVQGLYETIT